MKRTDHGTTVAADIARELRFDVLLSMESGWIIFENRIKLLVEGNKPNYVDIIHTH